MTPRYSQETNPSAHCCCLKNKSAAKTTITHAGNLSLNRGVQYTDDPRKPEKLLRLRRRKETHGIIILLPSDVDH